MKPGDSRGLFFAVILFFAVASTLALWLLVEGCGALKEGTERRQADSVEATSGQ